MSTSDHAIGGNPYLFISHSHADIKEVRVIRNELEECGYEPICFYLASLEDDNEILDLIKREIDARRFFIYVDSPNARNSLWVRSELEYLAGTKRRIDRTILIDVDMDAEDKVAYLQEEARKLMQSLRVFVSYSMRDRRVVRPVVEALEQAGYSTFHDRFLDANTAAKYQDELDEMIVDVAETGCFVAFINESYLGSRYLQGELKRALDLNASVVCVVTDGLQLPVGLRQVLGLPSVSTVLIKEPSNQDDIDAVVKAVEQELKRFHERR